MRSVWHSPQYSSIWITYKNQMTAPNNHLVRRRGESRILCFTSGLSPQSVGHISQDWSGYDISNKLRFERRLWDTTWTIGWIKQEYVYTWDNIAEIWGLYKKYPTVFKLTHIQSWWYVWWRGLRNSNVHAWIYSAYKERQYLAINIRANLKTLFWVGKREQAAQKTGKYSMNISDFSEFRRIKSGKQNLSNGGKLYYSGRVYWQHIARVGLMMDKVAKNSILELEPISPRMIRARFI